MKRTLHYLLITIRDGQEVKWYSDPGYEVLTATAAAFRNAKELAHLNFGTRQKTTDSEYLSAVIRYGVSHSVRIAL